MVIRSRLIDRLNAGLHGKLTLVSAPAGFGKTTLVGEWIAGSGRAAAWLSLDERENDPARFLAYLVAALRTVAAALGKGVLSALQSPRQPPAESMMTALLNEMAAIPEAFTLVLDDYHAINAEPVDKALAFLIEHLPSHMHLIIATREDPNLPLARLRARGQLTELRAADLRFTPSEAAGFLNQVMGLNLSAEDTAALESRTEGWIAGLQMAAISMQGHHDASGFVKSFTGSHHFVLDYLLEEVLERQPKSVQDFLLCTSILESLCGPLCDAVLHVDPGRHGVPSASGQETLEYLERVNLFIVPLDNERRWYRYHHLFADLLTQRVGQRAAGSSDGEKVDAAVLHGRASRWYEDNGMEIEAFTHAAAANDVERAARLVEGKGVPLQFRGASALVLRWLASLPKETLDARPSLWVMYASALSITSRLDGVEEKLQAAEAALEDAEPDDGVRNLIGHIAAIRAMMAAIAYQVESTITLSRRALEYLHPNNHAVRAATTWKLGWAYYLQGDRAAAARAYAEAMSTSRASGNVIVGIMAALGLATVQENENQLHQAAETYRNTLGMAGDPPHPIVYEAHLGLARICYEWNDLYSSERHLQESILLAPQLAGFDRPLAIKVLLSRLKLAQGDAVGAAAVLAEAEQDARRGDFANLLPEIAAAQVRTLLHLGNLEEAARLAQSRKLPLCQARVHLAGGDPSAALAVLAAYRRQMEKKGLQDELFKAMVLQAIAHQAHGDKDAAVQLLTDSLVSAQPGGFIRTYIDEGDPMERLLAEVSARGTAPEYVGALTAAFAAEERRKKEQSAPPPAPPARFMVDPLSQRESEVLNLIAQGLSNNEIGDRLFLALSTVKGHCRIIFDKLQVRRRTEAVARAREMGLL